MHVPAFGRSLKLPLTLDDLAKPGFAVAPGSAGAVSAPPVGAAAPSADSAAATPLASGSGPLLGIDPTHPAAGAAQSSVAITFDDGPHPEGTPKILEILAEFEATATFFLVGEQVIKRPALARQIVAQGHTVGLHGHCHRPHPTRKARHILEDFERGAYAIADATGVEPRMHRPPYGIYSPASLRIARDRGLQPLLWSKWGKDWRKMATAEQITHRVVGGLHAGDVVLLHDADYYSARRSHRRTAAALPEILKTLQSAELGTVAFA